MESQNKWLGSSGHSGHQIDVDCQVSTLSQIASWEAAIPGRASRENCDSRRLGSGVVASRKEAAKFQVVPPKNNPVAFKWEDGLV